MYNFHYNFMLKHFGADNVTLGFTDTDSFFYKVAYEGNIYKKLKEADSRGEWMDFSNYPTTHENYSSKNRLVPGKFKDEGSASPYVDGVFLRSKMYSTINVDSLLSKSTAKGIPTRIKKKYLVHQKYL